MTSSLRRNEPRFRAVPRFDDRGVTVSLDGEADLDANDSVRTLLEELHAEAQSRKATTVTVDLTKLEFLSSSGIKHFIVWIRNDANLAEPYQIRFLSNPLVPWQKKSLEALRCFNAKLVTVETAGQSS